MADARPLGTARSTRGASPSWSAAWPRCWPRWRRCSAAPAPTWPPRRGAPSARPRPRRSASARARRGPPAARRRCGRRPRATRRGGASRPCSRSGTRPRCWRTSAAWAWLSPRPGARPPRPSWFLRGVGQPGLPRACASQQGRLTLRCRASARKLRSNGRLSAARALIRVVSCGAVSSLLPLKQCSPDAAAHDAPVQHCPCIKTTPHQTQCFHPRAGARQGRALLHGGAGGLRGPVRAGGRAGAARARAALRARLPRRARRSRRAAYGGRRRRRALTHRRRRLSPLPTPPGAEHAGLRRVVRARRAPVCIPSS